MSCLACCLYPGSAWSGAVSACGNRHSGAHLTCEPGMTKATHGRHAERANAVRPRANSLPLASCPPLRCRANISVCCWVLSAELRKIELNGPLPTALEGQLSIARAEYTVARAALD